MSTTAANGFKQEMPPQGGYKEIKYERVLPQKLFKNWSFVALNVIALVYGTYYFRRRKRYMGKLAVERYDHYNALEPLLQAEKDRAFLRHMRYNREVERELMKNVPDWTVGTLWGKPVYKTLPEGTLPDMVTAEWYAHRHEKQYEDYFFPDKWT